MQKKTALHTAKLDRLHTDFQLHADREELHYAPK